MSFLVYRKRKSTNMYKQTGASTEIAEKVSKREAICGTLYNLYIIIVKFIAKRKKMINFLVSPLGSLTSPSAEREARVFTGYALYITQKLTTTH